MINDECNINLSSIPTSASGKTKKWAESIGCIVPFNYKGISGELKIVNYELTPKREVKLTILYKDEEYTISCDGLKKCQLRDIVNGKHLVVKQRETKIENTLEYTASWMMEYFVNPEDAKGEVKTSTKKVLFKCPKCGRIASKLISIAELYSYHKIGCECEEKSYYPEVVMSNILNKYNIQYISQITCRHFDWIINKYRYDFYLPDFNCIIEVNGGQHYSEYSLSKMTLQEQQERDIFKKELALNNGITHYFEIDASKGYNAKHIINSCIETGLFDLLGITDVEFNFDDLKIKSGKFDILPNILEFIKENSPKIITQADICEEFCISRSTCQVLLSHLSERPDNLAKSGGQLGVNRNMTGEHKQKIRENLTKYNQERKIKHEEELKILSEKVQQYVYDNPDASRPQLMKDNNLSENATRRILNMLKDPPKWKHSRKPKID